jgi:thioredoxin 1
VRIRRKHSDLHHCGKGKTMIEITERDFEKEVLECGLPVFACFTTQWCHSCYPTCLFADQLVKEYDGHVKFVRLDTEKCPGIAEKYHVIAVPTILIFQNAQEVNRLLGFQDRSSLRPLMNSVTGRNETTERLGYLGVAGLSTDNGNEA